ncbi:uncharacterized protein LOC131650861 [Vicia villosa]|uniref:uncharacterized protein LOC131650861 n=1 Tax=Vicia villosa TaxID=3911 RepID=UPI00273C6BAE|nr:uncharacterized protein LOC131650861 [Vicia villosa]
MILRAFEIVSGLGINYHKCKLIGINISNSFMEAATNFHSCKMEDNNFLFLGIPIGKDPKKEAMWNPTLDKLKKRLGGWKNQFLYLGDYYRDPIVNCFHFDVHNGYTTPFWESIWLDEESLKNAFSELFESSRLKGVSVGAMGGWIDGIWKWRDFGISVNFLDDAGFKGRIGLLYDRLLLYGGPEEENSMDVVSWEFNNDSVFSVASCYNLYSMNFIPFGSVIKHDEAFRVLWKAEVPFKIKAFGWRLFLDRLPTKELLVYRGISLSLDNLKCVFCGFGIESRNHSFFAYSMVKHIWSEIALWVGKWDSLEEEFLSSFMDWHYFFRLHKVKNSKADVIWLATS